jgi:iron complex outermembrane receptor protein
MKTERWRRAFALAACLSLCIPSLAQADARTEARRAFRRGMQLVDEGKYREGIEFLERAYDTLPHPNVLYNLALAYMYAGDLELASSYLQRYIEDAPAGDAEEAERLLKTVETKLAEQRGAKPQAPVATAAQPQQATAEEDTVSAIRNAASEIEQIAKAAGSDNLEQRANTLRATADKLEQERAAEKAADQSDAPQESAAAPVARAPAEKRQADQGAYEEQVVSASRFAESPVDAPNATAIVTAQDIRLTGITSVAELIRRVAGVEVNTVAPSHAELSIRGLNRRTSNKVLFLIDGRPLRQDLLGTTYPELLPLSVEDIERIEVIRGPASALYGADAFSGVVNIIMRAPGTGDSYVGGGFGNHGQRRAVAGFTGKSGPVAYRLGAGFIQAYNAVLAAGGNRVDVAPLNDNPDFATDRVWVNGEVRYDLARQTTLTLGGALVDGDLTVQGLSRLGQVTLNDTLQSQSYVSLTTPIGLRLGSFWNRFDGNAGSSVISPNGIDLYSFGTIQDIVDTTLEWSGEANWPVAQRFTVGAGYRYKSIRDWSWMDQDQTQNHYAVYLQDVIQVTEELKFQLSARMDRHPLLSSLQFSPRGSIVYRFVEGQSLRVSAGRAFRGPSFMESYLDVQNGAPIRAVSARGIGNRDLAPESITSYELGYTNQASDFFALEANAYMNLVKDLILFTDVDTFTISDFADPASDLSKFAPTSASFPVSSLAFENEDATYRQLGGELGARVFPVDGLDVYTNYSVHDTRPNDRTKVDAARANEQQTSVHKVNAGLQYRARFGLDTSVDVHWFSKQLWVEQVTDLQRGVVFASFDQPAFVLVNGRLGYRLLSDRLEVGVVGTNLAFQHKRQHPFGQPLDTRVLGTAKLRF